MPLSHTRSNRVAPAAETGPDATGRSYVETMCKVYLADGSGCTVRVGAVEVQSSDGEDLVGVGVRKACALLGRVFSCSSGMAVAPAPE